ncbi:MAG TPA: xanthine dehydrogenase family protein molybdopterin-binding subunit [Rhizomicrobium sp.]|nr:xanthine dehydrogenase family protein molybdopterin-binding subunit [Rhizomicrobium sp.]
MAKLDTTRRGVLATGLTGTFLFAFHLPVRAFTEPEEAPDSTQGKFAPNAFIRIDRTGKITLVMPQVEMGQGVYTSIPMIIAEELDADFAQVAFEHAPANEKLYANPMLGVQATGNSNSVRAWWKPLRTAGATAKAMLVEAAAQQWKVDPASCTAANSVVTHTASGRKLAYGQLVDAAAKVAPPKNVTLKDPKDFVLIGRRVKRLDTPNKTDGKVVYGIDAMLPGMKFATIEASPVLGGKVAQVDQAAAMKVPGVEKVIVLDDMVAVVGQHFWAAKKGLEAANVTWNDGANAKVNSAQIWNELRAASRKDGLVAKQRGDAAKALGDGEKVEAAYEMPFLAHATMEPMNCTVQLKPDSCEIWLGTQIMARVQSTAAQLTGLPPEKVIVHNHLLGGGFGRRLEPDMALKAIRVAQHLNGEPVKVVWTREEDLRHDVYRPVYRDVIQASLKDGRIKGWKYKVSGSSVVARWLPPAFTGNHDIDFDTVDSAVDTPYDLPDFRVEVVRCEPPGVTTGFWRGVGPNNNVFAIECFMDELAKKAGKDPVQFRLDHLHGSPRHQAVLKLVAEKSGWGSPLPERVGRGVSVQPSFASYIATVVEAEVDHDGEVRLRRVTCAVDTGIAVNPDTIEAQLQGGLIFGLTAALYGDVPIKHGRVQLSNFNDYRMLRIDQTPPIAVHVVKSAEPPGGIGETGVTAGPPALRNAIFAATGIPLRRMPVDREVLAGRKQA